jgi:molybdate transport system substrate-binding protein
MFRPALVALGLAALGVPAAALSTFATQAIEVALVRLANEYRAQTGHEVTIRFDTSLGLGRRVAAGEPADVLVASASVVDQAIKDGRAVRDTRRKIGRIGLGLATRRGARQPDISSVDALVTAMRGADMVLYSQRTSGLHIEKMLASLGLDVEL